MPLPELIEIVPLDDKRVRAEITVPGSKSITNRALILAALAAGEVTLEGALWSEDTQIMVAALHALGFEVQVQPDPNESGNRRLTVKGQNGRIPKAGTAEHPLELRVGNAGTAARFLAALVCLGRGVYRLTGVPRMHERPQAALFQALRELGYRVDSPNNKLPAVIHSPARPGASVPPSCTVRITESSQFASALLLCARAGGWRVRIEGEDSEEASYVEMTRRLIEQFPANGGSFRIEPDASSGSYFWAANEPAALPHGTSDADAAGDFSAWPIRVRDWPASSLQIDHRWPRILARISQATVLPPTSPEAGYTISRRDDLADAIMTAIALAPLMGAPGQFTDLGRLRLQECERVAALRTELTKCGARITETGDTLTVYPSPLHGAVIATYNDHRMAMCFAILGLKVPGIKIHNPDCVKKTFPNFFQKLAAAPPNGLGAIIRDARTGRQLAAEALLAE